MVCAALYWLGRDVVMSLWPVSDYVTREMMTNYYTGLGRVGTRRSVETSST